MKRKLIYTALILTVLAGAFIYYQWNKPKRTAADEKAVAQLSASELFSRYSANAAEANTAFLDKVIYVSGTVGAVETSANGITLVTLNTDDPMAAVTCNYSLGNLVSATVGQPLSVKGICAGIQGDMMPAVILTQCVEERP